MKQEDTRHEPSPALAGRWHLLESAPDAMVIVDCAGQIVFVNSQAERVFGYEPQELLGQPVETLIPEQVRHAHVRDRTEYIATPRTRANGIGA